MPQQLQDNQKYGKWKTGQLQLIDELDHGSDGIAAAIRTYAESVDSSRQSALWRRTLVWMENILFGLGRHYLNDVLLNRLTTTDSGQRRLFRDSLSRIPQPTNDLLGRYIETNISLLTENRPRPRITAKSERRDDRKAAELAELTMEFLWDELKLADKHREIARMCLYTGICFLEVCYDPLMPRYMAIPETREEQYSIAPGPGGEAIQLPVTRQVPVVNEAGLPELRSKISFGDVTAKIVSPFEMHVPAVDYWNGEKMAWIMKESYYPIDILRQMWTAKGTKRVTSKKNGWFIDNLDKVTSNDVQNLPLWWYERLADLVEGPGPTVYMGAPERWANHTVVRVFDRKPSPEWPKGRTVIIAGDQLIYDSPKNVGARAFNPRWPNRWHPYIRYTWERQPGSVWGRALLTKLIPKIKRINSIDVSAIMWRRTVPIATWVVPKGSNPISDLWRGGAGNIWEYDPRMTQQHAPTPIYPPPFPDGILQEREIQMNEMEHIAGTEQILKGQRPPGTTSGAMLEYLRRNALASRSPIMQAWDESIEDCGSALLMETVRHVGSDPRYAERLRVLAREKSSRITINQFAGTDIKDNVIVRVDTASEAMTSREAKQARAIEVLQFAQGLMILPPTLRKRIVDDLGWPDSMVPQSADIQRAQLLLSLLRQNRFDLVVPFPEDDPYVFHEFFVDTMKDEEFLDMSTEQQARIVEMAEYYEKEIERIEMQRLEMQLELQGVETEGQMAVKEAGSSSKGGG